jgi:hypothetical protein
MLCPLTIRLASMAHVRSVCSAHRFKTSSKLAKQHMQCKKSEHNEYLRKSFENIIIFKERLMNNWKTSSKQKYMMNTVLNTKGTELTSKLCSDMVSSPRKLLLEAHSHKFLT